MLDLFRRLITDEEGQGMVEYGLIIGLVAVVAIVALEATGGHIKRFFQFINTKLSSVTTG